MSDKKKLPPPSPAQQKAVCEVGERVLKDPPPKPAPPKK